MQIMDLSMINRTLHTALAASAVLILALNPAAYAAEAESAKLLQIEDLIFHCASTTDESRLITQERAVHRQLAERCNRQASCLVEAEGFITPQTERARCSGVTVIAQCAAPAAALEAVPAAAARANPNAQLVESKELEFPLARDQKWQLTCEPS